MAEEKHKPKRSWKRKLLKSALVLIILLVALLAVIKFWVAPGVIRWAAVKAIHERWDGQAEIEGVRFNYWGPMVLGRLCLYGPDGQMWLEVEGVELTLADWPGLAPVLRAVDVNRVTVSPRFGADRLEWPLKPAPETELDMSQYVDLDHVTVRLIETSVYYGEGEQTDLADLELKVTRAGSGYEVALAPLAGEGLTLRGNVGEEGSFEGTVRMAHEVKAGESAFLLAALAGFEGATEGRLNLDLAIAIDSAGMETLDLRGEVAVEDGSVRAGERLLCEGLEVRAEFLGDSVQLNTMTARTPGGSISGQARATLPWGRELEYDLDLNATEIPLAAAADLVNGPGLSSGLGQAELHVQGRGFNEVRVSGSASLEAVVEEGQLGQLRQATGSSEFDITVTGNLLERQGLEAQGDLTLRDWRLANKEGQEWQAELTRLVVQFAGRHCTISDMQGQLGQAGLSGDGEVVLPSEDEPMRYSVHIRTDSAVDLGEAADWLGEDLPMGSVEMDVTADGYSAQEIHAAGWLAGTAEGQWGEIARGSGRANFDVVVRQAEMPEETTVNGEVTVEQGRAETSDAVVANEISGRFVVAGHTAAIQDLRAHTGGGWVTGFGEVTWSAEGVGEYEATLNIEGVDASEVVRSLGQDSEIASAVATAFGEDGKIASAVVSTQVVVRGNADGMTLQGAGELAAVTRGPDIYEAAGGFDHDLALTFATEDTAMRLNGTVGLSDWRAAQGEKTLAEQMTAQFGLEPGRIEVANASAEMAWGTMEATGEVLYGEEGIIEARAQLGQFDLAALAEYYKPGLGLTGSVADLQVNMELRDQQSLHLTATGNAAAGVGEAATDAGLLAVDLTVDHIDEPETRVINGTVRMMGWTLAGPRGEVLRDITLDANFTDRVVTLTQLRATTAEGELFAGATISLGSDGPSNVEGQLRFTGLDLPSTLAMADKGEMVRRGTLSSNITLSGVIDEELWVTAAGDVRMELEHEKVTEVGGGYQANLRFVGPLGDRDRLMVYGTGEGLDWMVNGAGGELVEQLGLNLVLNGRSCDIDNIRGSIGTGQVRGLGRVSAPVGGEMNYRGELAIVDVELEQVSRALGQEGETDYGQLQAEYVFSGRGTELENAHGQGTVTIVDGRFRPRGAFEAILVYMQVIPLQAGEFDVDGMFYTEGPVVIFDKVNMAGSIMVIMIEPGSQVDLETRELDAYVVAGLVEEIDTVFGQFEILNITRNLLHKLTRLHVTGPYDDSSGVRISKEILRDISEGTIDFLREVVLNGNEVNLEDILDIFRRIAP
ncbi:MAG: hypothetical protein JW936_08885 [Sedimentisphaerales bacterium]|nr:hypothetical protein [Sedimentisphaerales bacterium]